MFTLHNLKTILDQYKKLFLAAIIALILVVPATFVAASKLNQKNDTPKSEEVLGTSTSPSPDPSPSESPSPTPTPSPSPLPKISPKPTPTPSPSPSPSTSSSSSTTQSSSDSSSSDNQSSSSPTPAPSPSPTPSPTPSPSPVALSVEFHIDYSGASSKTADTYNQTFTQGQTAWDVMKSAIGEGNIAFTQYSFGVFVTGINGVNTSGNQFWEFKVNGQSSNVGVSDYVCNNGDKLEFVVSTF